MARFRRRARRRSSGRSFSKRRRRSGGSSFGMGTNSLIQPDAMIYGAIRGKVSTMLDPITSKIPLGSISDEVGMGLLNWFVAKKTGGMLRNVAMKGLVIENARLGDAIVQGGMGVLTGSQGTTQEVYTYG